MIGVVRHVIDAIAPASAAHAEGARLRLAHAGAPMLERLGVALAGAQHTPAPRVTRRALLVVAGDHGAGDPGIALGADHPTITRLHAIDDGTAALAQVARTGRLPIVMVDAGVAEPTHVPAIAVTLGTRGPSRDLAREPASTVVDAALAVEAGIALAISLAEPAQGLDVVMLGAVGVGAEVAAAAIAGALLEDPIAIGDDDAGVAAAYALGRGARGDGPLELLARFGGPETGVLVGAILAAASLNAAIVLDSYATGAAAAIAAAYAPAVRGHLIAAHVGAGVHAHLARALGLAPIFDVGLGHGDGTGAAMLAPLLDQVAALTTRG